MSTHTTVILTLETSQDEQVEELNRIVFSGGSGLLSCEDKRFDPLWYGGSKHLEHDIFLGVFRDLDLDALVAGIRKVEWPRFESVQLFVRRGGDKRFTEIEVFTPPARGWMEFF